MPSNNKTPYLGLNKWLGNEFPKRQDFIEDNEKIDTALKTIESNRNDIISQLNEKASKIYVDSQIDQVSATGIPKLMMYSYDISITAVTNTVEIPMDLFSKDTDTVLVFKDTRIVPTSDYKITQEEGQKGKITFSGTIDNCLISIYVLKNVPIGEDGAINGRCLSVDSIPMDRVMGLTSQLSDMATKTTAERTRKITFGTSEPTGGADGDIYLQYE